MSLRAQKELVDSWANFPHPRTPRAGALPSVGGIACSQYVPRFSIHASEATPVHGQFLEKGTFNMGERCGEWIENGGGTGA